MTAETASISIGPISSSMSFEGGIATNIGAPTIAPSGGLSVENFSNYQVSPVNSLDGGGFIPGENLTDYSVQTTASTDFSLPPEVPSAFTVALENSNLDPIPPLGSISFGDSIDTQIERDAATPINLSLEPKLNYASVFSDEFKATKTGENQSSMQVLSKLGSDVVSRSGQDLKVIEQKINSVGLINLLAQLDLVMRSFEVAGISTERLSATASSVLADVGIETKPKEQVESTTETTEKQQTSGALKVEENLDDPKQQVKPGKMEKLRIIRKIDRKRLKIRLDKVAAKIKEVIKTTKQAGETSIRQGEISIGLAQDEDISEIVHQIKEQKDILGRNQDGSYDGLEKDLKKIEMDIKRDGEEAIYKKGEQVVFEHLPGEVVLHEERELVETDEINDRQEAEIFYGDIPTKRNRPISFMQQVNSRQQEKTPQLV